MKKSFLIVGLGRLGLSIIEELSKQNVEVMAIDINEEAVLRASDLIEHCFICDSTSENALRQLGVENISHAIVTIGENIQSTILTTIVLKEIGIKKVSVRIDDEYYEKIMYKIGADEVIFPEKIAGVRYANSILSENVVDYFRITTDFGIFKICVSPNFKPTALIELDSRNKYGVNIISINRDNNVFLPKGSDTINPNDEILVIGQNSKIAKFDSIINKK
ncbi:MAG: potassium channel family protein [Bacilli bacterium]